MIRSKVAKMRTLCVAFIMCLATIYACKHTVDTPPITGGGTGGGGGTPPAPGTGTGQNQFVCFDDVLPIFRSSCAKSGCHDAASKQDGYILDSYANIMNKGIKPGNAEDSDIYEAITEDDNDEDRMPQKPNPPLTKEQKELIKKWINEGAKNTTNCSTGCDVNVFSYSAGIKPILDANCVGCHNGPSAPLGINLTTYTGVKTVASNGRLLGAVTHQAGFKPMPQGSAKLSDCKISQIQKWVQAGAPNN